jgi:hypothetical protein
MNDMPPDHALRGDVFSEHCPSREVLKHVTVCCWWRSATAPSALGSCAGG